MQPLMPPFELMSTLPAGRAEPASAGDVRAWRRLPRSCVALGRVDPSPPAPGRRSACRASRRSPASAGSPGRPDNLLAERLDQQRAEAGPGEDDLDCHGAAQDPADPQAENGDNGPEAWRSTWRTWMRQAGTPLAWSRSTKSFCAVSIIATRVTRATSAMPPSAMVATGRTSDCQCGRRKPETSRAARKKQG